MYAPSLVIITNIAILIISIASTTIGTALKVRLAPAQVSPPPVVGTPLLIGISKAAVDPSKERMRGKKVDFGHSYQPIDVNCWMVHENRLKRDTYNTAISQCNLKEKYD